VVDPVEEEIGVAGDTAVAVGVVNVEFLVAVGIEIGGATPTAWRLASAMMPQAWSRSSPSVQSSSRLPQPKPATRTIGPSSPGVTAAP
jgi:hypothetical protein